MPIPLAERMRPKSLADFIGQEHLTGKDGVLSKAITSGNIHSFILWGPPGVGKTSLAQVLANTLERPFYTLSAINSGVKDVREAIEKARKQRFFNTNTPILFIDEIHRFSKSQQDSLLGAVEKGIITLIGATTENPSFEVISALLSRCQVYTLHHLTEDDLVSMLNQAIAKDEYLKDRKIHISEHAALLKYSGGDGRRLLNSFEILINQHDEEEDVTVTDELVKTSIQKNLPLYDKTGEQHYDIISAFIKSIRGSDPNASVYYLARMIEGGEDPKFIARRLIISASEDIGLANPNALLIANAAFDAVARIGMPEGRIILSQAVIYLATSPKSNASYMAIRAAQALVKEDDAYPIPLALRNAPTALMKKMNYGKNYQYAHDHTGNFVEAEYLPEEISGHVFYKPGNNPQENRIKERLSIWWKNRYSY